MKRFNIDVAQLYEMRDHYLREAQRIDEAIVMFRGFAKIAKRAAVVTGRTQARAVHERATPGTAAHERGTTKTFIERHANLTTANPRAERKRLEALAEKQGLGLSPRAIESAYNRARTAATSRRKSDLKKKGDRAIDRFRRVFATSNGTPLTRDEVIAKSKLAEISNPRFVRQSAAKVLEALVRYKEIKPKGDGYIAGKLQPPTES
jgi:hypothetical protein